MQISVTLLCIIKTSWYVYFRFPQNFPPQDTLDTALLNQAPDYLQGDGYRTLTEGQKVSYLVSGTADRLEATEVKVEGGEGGDGGGEETE